MFFIAIATAVTLIIWWILDLIRTDEKAIRIKFGQLGRKGRRLGLQEEFLWTAQNQVGYGVNVNAVVIYSVEDIEEEHVRQALDALWRRHPLLRCSIITISKGKKTMNYFTEISGKPSYDLQDAESLFWTEVFEHALCERFASSGPQWRVKMASSWRVNDKYNVHPFVFSFNSCIADGASIMDGVFKDFQTYLTKAVYHDNTDSANDSSLMTSASDVIGTSVSDMSSSIMSTSGSMFGSFSHYPNTSEEVSEAAMDSSVATDLVSKPKGDDVKVLRLLPAPEYIYKELQPRWYERLASFIVNRFYHKPFLSSDPVSARMQAHLKPRAPISKTGVLTFLLNEKETESFLTECCRKRVSVTSAVSAAAGVSLQALLMSKTFHGNLPLKVNTLLMCNMRQGSLLAVPKHTLGNHEGLLDVTISLPKSDELSQSIWKPAVTMQKLFHRTESVRVFSWARWLNFRFGRKDGVAAFLSAASKRSNTKSYAFCVRDRGDIKYDEDSPKPNKLVTDKCLVRACYFTSAEHQLGLALFSIGVVTIRGRIYVTIGYDRHVIDDIIAKEFKDLLKENLTRPEVVPKEDNIEPKIKTFSNKLISQLMQFWGSAKA